MVREADDPEPFMGLLELCISMKKTYEGGLQVYQGAVARLLIVLERVHGDVAASYLDTAASK